MGLAEEPSEASAHRRRLRKTCDGFRHTAGYVTAPLQWQLRQRGRAKHKGWLLLVPGELGLMPTSPLNNDSWKMLPLPPRYLNPTPASASCGIVQPRDKSGYIFHVRACLRPARRIPRVSAHVPVGTEARRESAWKRGGRILGNPSCR